MAGLTNFTKIADPYSIGDRFETDYTFDLDNSYTTGGYAFDQTKIGFAPTNDPSFRAAVTMKNGFTFLWDGTTWTAQVLKVFVPVAVYTATFDPASLAGVTSRDDAITFTGVASTDVCLRVDPPAAILASVVVQNARVTGTNAITCRLTNASAGAVDVATGTWTAYVAAANGAPHEVPNGADLSGVTGVHVRGRGKYRL